MSLRLEMLRAARRAPKLLGASTRLVRRFFLENQNLDGGFKNRAGRSDLYYMPFGLAGVAALSELAPKAGDDGHSPAEVAAHATRYLAGFGSGAGLDFVHLCCLARSWAALRDFGAIPDETPAVETILSRLERHRTSDGGYHPARGREAGTAYGALLALGAYQDLAVAVPEPHRLAAALALLQTADGGFTNELRPGKTSDSAAIPGTSDIDTNHPRGSWGASGSTNATAAAVSVLRHLGVAPGGRVREWLLARAHPGGGFRAAVNSPIPDLLSTATALQALAALRAPLDLLRESCLDFVDSLWTNAGGFHGHWGDDVLDVEYTLYGLLALGNLAGEPFDEHKGAA